MRQRQARVREGFIHRQKYAEVSRAPVHGIIVTQAHIDRVGGLVACAGPETEILAHVNNAPCQADDARIQGFRARRRPRFLPRPGAGDVLVKVAACGETFGWRLAGM